ncbi:hypothetical protein [Sphingomonas sp.]|uniref:hypothetical protein n=1 Tax=Sphingomonas sp. TaxID=28214 RepID=UPI003B3B9DAA
MRLVLLSVLAFCASTAQAETLHLICVGDGAANKATQQNGYFHDSDGYSARAEVTGQRSQAFSDQADIEIEGSTGRIRMPRVMLPPIHGGKDGWMDIEKLSISDREITGSVGVNFMNSPKLRIDRITSMVSMAGKAGNFAGRCSAYDPDKAQRAF